MQQVLASVDYFEYEEWTWELVIMVAYKCNKKEINQG
jgi:hypothetical protein